jgi:hypothetical protein
LQGECKDVVGERDLTIAGLEKKVEDLGQRLQAKEAEIRTMRRWLETAGASVLETTGASVQTYEAEVQTLPIDPPTQTVSRP